MFLLARWDFRHTAYTFAPIEFANHHSTAENRQRTWKGQTMNNHTLHKYADVLDVDDLMNRCLGNVGFACRVLQILHAGCETDIDVLEKAAAESDFDRLYHVSHRLKGAFANASARQLSQLADDVCIASQSRDQDTSLRRTNELRDRWNDFSTKLREVVGEPVA